MARRRGSVGGAAGDDRHPLEHVGTKLSDKSKVTPTNYSPRLPGLVMLMVS